MNSIGTIAPPVGGGARVSAPSALRLASFLIGSVTGGAAIGVAAAWIGARLLISDARSRYVIVVLIALAVLGDLLRSSKSYPRLTRHWQVPRRWIRWPSPLYEFVFGVALGAGIVTVVSYTSMYGLLLALVLLADTESAIAVMTVFGIARALPMLLVSLGMVTPPTGSLSTGAAERIGAAMETSWMKGARAAAGALLIICLLSS